MAFKFWRRNRVSAPWVCWSTSSGGINCNAWYVMRYHHRHKFLSRPPSLQRLWRPSSRLSSICMTIRCHLRPTIRPGWIHPHYCYGSGIWTYERSLLLKKSYVGWRIASGYIRLNGQSLVTIPNSSSRSTWKGGVCTLQKQQMMSSINDGDGTRYNYLIRYPKTVTSEEQTQQTSERTTLIMSSARSIGLRNRDVGVMNLPSKKRIFSGEFQQVEVNGMDETLDALKCVCVPLQKYWLMFNVPY